MEKEGRFTAVSSAELDKLLLNKDSKNTQNSTKVAADLFQKYLSERHHPENFISLHY